MRKKLCQKETVIAIGNFDGVHIGHRQLLMEAAKLKKQLEEETGTFLKVLAMTFWPHPRSFFKDPTFKRIYDQEERDDLILTTGAVDELLTLPFDKDLMELPYKDFFQAILVEKYKAAAIVVGDNFHFGKDGEGDSFKLKALGEEAGIRTLIVPRVTYEGKPVSSSRIRSALLEGHMEEVNAMLGQPYQMRGTVLHGKGVGHLLGTPTVNLMLDTEMESPKEGVYLSRTYVEGEAYNSLSNVGTNPTFGNESLRTETYLLDYTGDLYGRKITVEYLRYLRPEITFESPEALKAQLNKDISMAKALFEEGN